MVPELETLEATWARLHGICGAATADDLIAYWQGAEQEARGQHEVGTGKVGCSTCRVGPAPTPDISALSAENCSSTCFLDCHSPSDAPFTHTDEQS